MCFSSSAVTRAGATATSTLLLAAFFFPDCAATGIRSKQIPKNLHLKIRLRGGDFKPNGDSPATNRAHEGVNGDCCASQLCTPNSPGQTITLETTRPRRPAGNSLRQGCERPPRVCPPGFRSGRP